MERFKKIREALLFASGENYRNLYLIKGLESMVLNQLDQAIAEEAACDDMVASANRVSIEKLQALFSGFDQCAPHQKKTIIDKGLQLLSFPAPLQTVRTHSHRDPSKSFDCEHIRKSLSVLSAPVTDIKGVGPRLQHLLKMKGVESILDLLYFIPRKYEDRRTVTRIVDAAPGCVHHVIGSVVRSGLKWYGRKKVFEAEIDDGSGILTAKWFKGNERYLRNLFTPGASVFLTGAIRGWNLSKEIIHPEFELMDEADEHYSNSLNFGKIVPIYSETEGLHQKVIRRIMNEALDRYSRFIINTLPESVLQRHRLCNLEAAIREIHFPDQSGDIEAFNNLRSDSLRTLIFEEFFFFELAMALRRRGFLKEAGIAFEESGDLIGRFHQSLPFDLTTAQTRVIEEILTDMRSPHPMNRLLHGDVGCGKTIVAMTAMLRACENGYQCALMAPTEILAEQHFRKISIWGDQIGIRTALLTGKLPDSEHDRICEMIKNGKVDIVVGTHALIQEGPSFRRLGLSVIDEQHRFGVTQRAALREKGINPDVLFMTATPIPRTLAMTVYGDLHISVIDEMPPGKKEIRTKVFKEKERARVYEIIRKELEKKHQVFVVYPLVEESEALDLKDATQMAERLRVDIFPEYRIGLLHGKMKPDEKNLIMQEFSDGAIDILVATTIVEVGIDIPRASLIVIEHAEHFGLSQLHQLRGRVGRSDIRSYCVLLAGGVYSQEASKRLRIMQETNDGFRIAETDLEIRGPGEFLGTRQSGLPDFRIGNIIHDAAILSEAQKEAFSVVESDPDLALPEHALLREVLILRWGEKLRFLQAG